MRIKNLAIGLIPVMALTAAVSKPAKAEDNWGCEVALCLATPGSPTTYSACVPPIKKLWNVLSDGGSMPSCSSGGINQISVRYDERYRQGRNINRNYIVATEYFANGEVKTFYLNNYDNSVAQQPDQDVRYNRAGQIIQTQ